MRRGLLAVVFVGLIAVAPAGAALPRSEVDRLDEARGPQIHFVYAVPSDGEDRRLDEQGLVESSVGLFQAWLAGQTGGPNLRVDTYQGALDVSFRRLSQTDAAIAANGAFVREAVQGELNAAGFNQPDRLYAVYYDGSSTYSCGGAFWPPSLQGNTVVMYLRGTPNCNSNALSPAGTAPRYWEFAMLHDILHGLGMVGTCAPHHTLSGHVSDFANDLMYAGTSPWGLPPTLDIGRDDYYGHSRSDCPDLARSPYLTSNPPPPPAIRVASFLAGARARPGKPLDARLDVTVDGARVTSGKARCTAKLAGKALRPVAVSFSGSAARCRWRVPLKSKGKRLTATVTATTAALSATRSFSRIVR
ncbi:MAG TPA: hypothetical protein VIE18_03080 [Gaiellaceae bacterium]|jgi:hypothetical protein